MHHRAASSVVALCVVAGLFAAAQGRAVAATLTVTQSNDSGPGPCDAHCTLREAVLAANDETTRPGPDVIRFAAPGTFALSVDPGDDTALEGDLDIKTDVTIQGFGAGATIIDGAPTFTDRIFHVVSGALRLRGVTVRDGATADDGGGVFSSGANLEISRSRIESNEADNGGGVFVRGGTLAVVDSVIGGNRAAHHGGGIMVGGSAETTLSRVETIDNVAATDGLGFGGGIQIFGPSTDVTISDALIAWNRGADRGGGIQADGTNTTVVITRSRILDNSATTLHGGGIETHLGAALSVYDSLIAKNSASDSGGAVRHHGVGRLTVARSLLWDNLATLGGALAFDSESDGSSVVASTINGNRANDDGGGVNVLDGFLALRHVTITSNVADQEDDGFGNSGGIAETGTGYLEASIVRGNIDRTGTLPDRASDCDSGVVSGGYNVVGFGCSLEGPSDVDAAAELEPLVFNGGPTQTRRKGDSPARDRVPVSNTLCRGTDQRRVPKPFGAGCDSRAYELTVCRGALVNVVGTNGPDRLIGTSRPDGILGLGGADTLAGSDGSDGLCGGAGNDRLNGGSGPDFLDGGPGTDRCVGGDGRSRFADCEFTQG